MSTHDLAAFTLPHIPVGKWFQGLIDGLNHNIGPFFDFIKDFSTTVITGISDFLVWVPAPVLIVLFALLALLVRGWKFGLFSLVALALLDSMQDWEPAMQSLALIVYASAIAVLLAVPIGIAAAEIGWIRRIARPVLDLMQTLPAFVYLIPAISFFGIGPVPGAVATVIFAMPPGVRLAELGIRQVDREVVEAGEAFGASPFKILTRIKIPLALPTIMAGVNQVIMLALSMVVIAGMVGAQGLGGVVYQGITRLDLATGFEGGLSVVILAIYLDRLTASLGDRLARRGTTAARGGLLGLLRRPAKPATADVKDTPEPANA